MINKVRLGKREREARKRHRRGSISFNHGTSEWITLKLGRKKTSIFFNKQLKKTLSK